MGTSTNGQLSFGAIFEEGFKFPWDTDKYDGDIESWWLDVRGFVNPIECPFDDNGNYKPGIDRDSPVINDYFNNKWEWLKANPIPVELVNYCHCDYPMWIIATKHIEAHRGYPVAVDPAFLADTTEAEKTLRAFLDEFGIELQGEIRWWLSSYWS